MTDTIYSINQSNYRVDNENKIIKKNCYVINNGGGTQNYTIDTLSVDNIWAIQYNSGMREVTWDAYRGYFTYTEFSKVYKIPKNDLFNSQNLTLYQNTEIYDIHTGEKIVLYDLPIGSVLFFASGVGETDITTPAMRLDSKGSSSWGHKFVFTPIYANTDCLMPTIAHNTVYCEHSEGGDYNQYWKPNYPLVISIRVIDGTVQVGDYIELVVYKYVMPSTNGKHKNGRWTNKVIWRHTITQEDLSTPYYRNSRILRASIDFDFERAVIRTYDIGGNNHIKSLRISRKINGLNGAKDTYHSNCINYNMRFYIENDTNIKVCIHNA